MVITPGQSSLLEHPSTLVQRALENVFIEIINKLADVYRWLVALAQLYGLALPARVKKPIPLTHGRAGGEDTVSLAEDVFHAFGLVRKVAFRTLYDADRVDPQVSDTELPRDGNGIFERRWQILELDIALVRVHVVLVCTEVRALPPRMGERQVSHGVSLLCLIQPRHRALHNPNVDESESGGQGGVACDIAVRVFSVAETEPVSKSLQMGMATST